MAAMNMTLDGFCDNTAIIADDGIHQHYLEVAKGKKKETILRTAE